ETGGKWRREISTALSRTYIGVLLLSPEFFASDFISEEELPALRRHADAGLLRLVAIPVKDSSYKPSWLTEYEWARRLNQPLDPLPSARRNTALVQIVDKIVDAALKEQVAVSAPVAVVPESAAVTIPEPVVLTGRLGPLHGVPAQRLNYLRRREYLDRVK